MKFAAVLLACSILAGRAWALTEPVPVNQTEQRVRVTEYNPDDIYLIRVPLGGETQIVLSPQERGHIFVSKAQEAWKRSHGGGNTIIFAADSNATMTYVHIVSEMPDKSSPRRYTFQLEPTPDPRDTNIQVASADGAPVQTQASAAAGYAVVRFTYQADDKERKQQAAVADAARKKQEAVEAWKARKAAWQQGGGSGFGPAVVRAKAPPEERKKCDFWFRGAGPLMPQAACDRGDRTTFFWAGQVAVPAIFVVDAAGHPHVAPASPNPEVRGEIIVPQTSQRWVLVYGNDMVLDLWNSAYDPYWTPGQFSTPMASR